MKSSLKEFFITLRSRSQIYLSDRDSTPFCSKCNCGILLDIQQLHVMLSIKRCFKAANATRYMVLCKIRYICTGYNIIILFNIYFPFHRHMVLWIATHRNPNKTDHILIHSPLFGTRLTWGEFHSINRKVNVKKTEKSLQTTGRLYMEMFSLPGLLGNNWIYVK